MPIIYLNRVSDEINNNSGSKCRPLRETSGDLQADLFEGKPTLLKKSYTNGLISWNPFELFINLAFPTSTKMTMRDKI